MTSRLRLTALAGAAALALLVGLIPALPASAAVVSENEPNSTTASAQTVALGSTVNASFRTSGDCDNNFYDCDFYRVSVPQAGRLILDLRFSDALGTESSFALSVLNSQGIATHSTTVASTDYSGARVRGLAIYVEAGVSYISLKARVSGFGSGYIWSGQGYTLFTSVTPVRAETERNGTTATADLITLGTAVYGATFSGDCNNGFYDCDYFRVSLPAAARLRLDFRFVCNLGTNDIYQVSTYNSSGATLSTLNLKGSDCAGALSRSTIISAPAGNFYVRVYARTTGLAFGQPYTLGVGAVLSPLTATPVPKVTGTAKVGYKLTAVPGAWGPAPVTLTYQWLRSGAAIGGATGSAYTLTAADLGKAISVQVTGAKTGYTSVAKKSAATGVVQAGTLTGPTPTISGTAKVGSTLTAVAGAWGPKPIVMAVQWFRNGVGISGATAPTYKLVAADAGKKITVRIVVTKTGYAGVVKLSAPVIPAP